jgi:hypothetical protein
MKLSRSLGIVVLLSVINFCSCGGASLATAPSMTGNWLLSVKILNQRVLDPAGNPTYSTVNSWAYLSQDGTSVTGTIEDNSCYAVLGIFPVTGSLIGDHLTLQSAVTLPPESENFVLNATVSANFTTLQGETINTPLSCGPIPALTTTGQQIESFSGTWKGTITSVSGPSATISATIVEAGAGSSGFPVLSGSVTFSNSPCFTSGTLAGNQTGPIFSGTISTTNGTLEIPQIGDSVISQVSGNQLFFSYSVQGGTCNGDYAQGTLTRQE